MAFVAVRVPEGNGNLVGRTIGNHEFTFIGPGPVNRKLVAVGDPDALDALEKELKPRFAGRLFISKSLPYFLEFASPNVTKGSGLAFLAERLGFGAADTVSFGDGENDVELLEWAGYSVAVENAHPRVKAVADWICPSAKDEAVAQVLESFLDSKR